MSMQWIYSKEIQEQVSHVKVSKDMIMFFLKNGVYIFYMLYPVNLEQSRYEWVNKKLVTCSTDFQGDVILGHVDGTFSRIIKQGEDIQQIDIQTSQPIQNTFIHLDNNQNQLIALTYLGQIHIFDDQFKLLKTIRTTFHFTSAISSTKEIYLGIKTRSNEYYLRSFQKINIIDVKLFEIQILNIEEQNNIFYEGVNKEIPLKGESLEMDINQNEDKLVLATKNGFIHIYDIIEKKITLNRIVLAHEGGKRPIFIQFYSQHLILYLFKHQKIQAYSFNHQDLLMKDLFSQSKIPVLNYVAVREGYFIIVYKSKKGDKNGKIKIFDKDQNILLR